MASSSSFEYPIKHLGCTLDARFTKYPMKHLGCTLDARFTTSGPTHQVGPDNLRRRENFGDIFLLAIFYFGLSPLFSFILFFFTPDAHFFVTARYVLNLRNGRNPFQVRNVDDEYVELSNLQQPSGVCPQHRETCQHNNVMHDKQECEDTPTQQCRFN
jgi:hypothetical protein